MPSGRQIWSATASRNQRNSSASSTALLCAIVRSARSTVCQSGLVLPRSSGAHDGAAAISTAASRCTTHLRHVVAHHFYHASFGRYRLLAVRRSALVVEKSRSTCDPGRRSHANAMPRRSAGGSRGRARDWSKPRQPKSSLPVALQRRAHRAPGERDSARRSCAACVMSTKASPEPTNDDVLEWRWPISRISSRAFRRSSSRNWRIRRTRLSDPNRSKILRRRSRSKCRAVSRREAGRTRRTCHAAERLVTGRGVIS